MGEELFTRGDRVAQEKLRAAIEYTKELRNRPPVNTFKPSNKSISVASQQKVAEESQTSEEFMNLEEVYKTFSEEFMLSVRAVLKKELRDMGKNFSFAIVFPKNNVENEDLTEEDQEEQEEINSMLFVLLKMEGETELQMCKLQYTKWKDEFSKLPLNYVFQKHYVCSIMNVKENPIKDFSEIVSDIYTVEY